MTHIFIFYPVSFILSDNILSLVKIFDVSLPDPSRILLRSFKDMLLFAEETTLSSKKRVSTKSSDPDRIQTRKFRILAAPLIDILQKSPRKPKYLEKKRVATKSPDPVRTMTSNYRGKCKISISFCLRSFHDLQVPF